MKFVVLNESPKSVNSITYQYAKYIERHFGEHSFEYIHVSATINKIENNENYFKSILKIIEEANGIFIISPVYYLTVPSQMVRFFELITERNVEKVFENKYAAIITTSIHYFDSFARDYLQGICDDLKIMVTDSYLGEMTDLLDERKRKSFNEFAEDFFMTISKNVKIPPVFSPIDYKSKPYIGKNTEYLISLDGSKKITILTDDKHNSNLSNMINVFKNSIHGNVEIINLNTIQMKSGCLGCLHCTYENVCVIKDDFKKLFDEMIETSHAIIYAFELNQREVSHRFKMYYDRTFIYGHIPNFKNKPVGYIVAGPLYQMPVTRQLIESRAQTKHFQSSLGIVTDQWGNDVITAELQRLAYKIVSAIETNSIKPMDFRGISGHIIFRDFVSPMKSLFKADHKHFKKDKLYDFPKNKKFTAFQSIIIKLIIKNPKGRKKIHSNEFMINKLKEL